MADPASKKTIVIQGLDFQVSWPYAAGHTCTEAEAKALNQTRKENLANNFAKRVKDAKALDEKNGNTAETAKLASEFEKLDAEYEFTLANVSAAAKLSPVDREARSMAKAAIVANLASKGRKLSDVPAGLTKDEWEAKVAARIEEIAAQDNVIAAAKKQVAAKEKAISAVSLDLGLDAAA